MFLKGLEIGEFFVCALEDDEDRRPISTFWRLTRCKTQQHLELRGQSDDLDVGINACDLINNGLALAGMTLIFRGYSKVYRPGVIEGVYVMDSGLCFSTCRPGIHDRFEPLTVGSKRSRDLMLNISVLDGMLYDFGYLYQVVPVP